MTAAKRTVVTTCPFCRSPRTRDRRIIPGEPFHEWPYECLKCGEEFGTIYAGQPDDDDDDDDLDDDESE